MNLFLLIMIFNSSLLVMEVNNEILITVVVNSQYKILAKLMKKTNDEVLSNETLPRVYVTSKHPEIS